MPIVVGIVTHLVIRKVAPYADPLLLPIAVVLNGLGLVMIHRLDIGLKQQAADNGFSFSAAAPTQVLWTAIGVALFLVARRVHPRSPRACSATRTPWR